MTILAVDIGGTKVAAGIVTEDGALLDRRDGATPAGNDPEALFAVVTALVEQLDGAGAAARVGVGCGGPMDRGGEHVSPINIPAWRAFPLRSRMIDLTGRPVTVDNDAKALALGEGWTGAARGRDNYLGMVVSTGVGGGLLLGGRAAPSPTGNSGHIGHVEVGGFDDACACGGHGCLEAVASGPNTVAWARRQGFSGTTGEDLAAADAAGDPIAVAAVERAGTAIGRAVASAANLVDLDVAAIGGGFSRVSPALFDHARAALRARTAFHFVSRVRIVPSGLSDEGPLIGAASLVHRPDLLT